MVEAICDCGQKQEVAENQIGEISACPCGRAMRLVSAEALPEGAGNGDFDAKLIIAGGSSNVGQQILLGGCMDIEIGKLPERRICLTGPKVSRLHAKLSRVDFGPSRWKIVDNQSTNGLFVNGERITEDHELQNGDLITLGDYELRFENGEAEEVVVLDEGAEGQAPIEAAAVERSGNSPLMWIVGGAVALLVIVAGLVLLIRAHLSHMDEEAAPPNTVAQATPTPTAGQTAAAGQTAPAANKTPASPAPTPPAPQPSNASSVAAAAPIPSGAKYPVPQGPIVKAGADGAPLSDKNLIVWPHQTIVSHYDSPADADTAFASLAPTVTGDLVLEKFGDTIFACFPPSDDIDQKWTVALQGTHADVRTETDTGVEHLNYTFACESVDDAEDIQAQWQTYFTAPHMMRLIPPWMPGDSRSKPQQDQQKLARATYYKIMRVRIAPDATMEQFNRGLFRAASRRDNDQVRIIAGQILDRQMELRKPLLSDLIRAGHVDTQLIKDYRAIPHVTLTDKGEIDISSAQWQALAQRLGQLPNTPGVERYSTQVGIALADGLRVHADMLHFIDPASGGPAVVQWLQNNGYHDIKYEVKMVENMPQRRYGGGIPLGGMGL